MNSLKCIAPHKLKEGDQIAFFDGEASPAVIRHIAQCRSCQAEVAQLESKSIQMTRMLFRCRCPDMDTLLLYGSAGLSQGQLKRTREHVQICAACQLEMGKITQPFFEEKIADFLGDVRGKFQVAMNRVASTKYPQLAFRGEKQHESYETGRYQILLSKLPPISAADLWQIEGQVTCPETPLIHWVGHVLLAVENGREWVTELDEFGSFSFDNVRSGSYALYFMLAEETVMIDEFMIP